MLSLDSSTTGTSAPVTSTIISNIDSIGGDNSLAKSITNNIATINECTSSTSTIKVSSEYVNGGSTIVSTNGISSGGVESSGKPTSPFNENNVIVNGDEGCIGIDKMTISDNNKHQQIDKCNANDIVLSNSNNDNLNRPNSITNKGSNLKDGNRNDEGNSIVERSLSSEIGMYHNFCC